MTDPDKRSIKQNSALPIILIALAVAAILGFAVWKFVLTPKEPAISTAPPAATEETAPVASAPQPMADAEQAPLPAGPTTREQFIPPAPEDACTELSRRIKEFFAQLDQRDYIKQRKLPADSHDYFAGLIDRLLADPPMVAGETSSLLAILNNTAHFYQVLRKDDVLLVKDILLREGGSLESTMELFHRWSLAAPDCPDQGIKVKLPLAGLYEYAGFFLNTLGGRSYLFRRESRVRLLVKYYSIMILDQANDQTLNRHGLDIRPSLNSLREEMKTATTLNGREHYLAVLAELQEKYSRQYGSK